MARKEYDNDYPSVTQILGVLRKISLENWFKYTDIKTITKESEEGKLIGSQIHEAIQHHIDKEEVKIETQYGEQVMNALNAFMQFKKDYPNIKLRRAEMALTSEEFGYNGTLDCVGKIGKDLVLLDWKTGKAKDKDIPVIYDEMRYQVAAYVSAFNETQEGKIIKAYILALAKDKVAYNFEELSMDEINAMFAEVFLPALRIWNYQNRRK